MVIPGDPLVLLFCGLILGLFWGVRYVVLDCISAMRDRRRTRARRAMCRALRQCGGADSPASRGALRARVLPGLVD